MTRVWSLFTGAGGLDLGLEEVGLGPELAVEVDPNFCETVRMNMPKARVLQADVAQIRAADLFDASGRKGEIDVMVGGPPCQSFSPGGNRAALSDPRGNLILEYLRIIHEVRPRFFVLENVGNLVTAALRHRPIGDRPGQRWNLASYSQAPEALFELDGPKPLDPDELSGSAIRFLLETAVSELDYSVTFGVLNAAEFGAAQKRLRFVMIGARDGEAPRLPDPTHGEFAPNPIRTLRDAIGDLVDNPGPGSQYTPTVREYFDLVPPGGNWRDLPEDVAKAAMGERSLAAGGGKTGFFRRLSWDKPSPTITGKANRKGSALCHPDVSRPLSVKECARLQGFPDSWRFSGAMNAHYTQIGNAVPSALGLGAGIALRSALSGRGPVEERSTQELLDLSVAKLRAAARNRVGAK